MCKPLSQGGQRCACPPPLRSAQRRAAYAVEKVVERANQQGTRIPEGEPVEARTVDQILADAGMPRK
jgi:hypothetical protein